MRCVNCGQMLRGGDRVLVLRYVTGIVAPDDPDGYAITALTNPEEIVHNTCPLTVVGA